MVTIPFESNFRCGLPPEPIIYLGKLNFQNTNRKESFCHFVNLDIMNNDFTLTIDENFQTKKGIKNAMHIAITFILYEDEDEY